MARKYITEQLKSEIREYYKTRPMGLKTLREEFGLSNPTLIKILGDIPRWPKTVVFNPNLNEDYFQNVDNEIKAYFIGLLISDGNVFVPKNGGSKSTSITLDKEDKYILEIFRKELGANNIVANDGRGCCYMAIRSNKIANDLSMYGIVPRKSLITYLPKNIDNGLMRHVIRGILDGDGNLYMKQTKSRHLHRVSFAGSHRLMEDIAIYLHENDIIHMAPKVYDYQDRNLSELKIQSIEDVHNFLSWIYDDATLFMERKHDKYNVFLDYYHLKQGNTEVSSGIAKGSETP